METMTSQLSKEPSGKAGRAFFAALLLWLALWGSLLCAAEPEASPAAPPVKAQPYAIAEAGAQAQETVVLQEEIENDLENDPLTREVEGRLERVAREIRQRQEATTILLSGNPPLNRLLAAENGWRRLGDQLTAWNRGLAARAVYLDELIAPLRLQQERWALTPIPGEETPPELLKRIKKLSASLEATREKAHRQRNLILRLQNRVIERNQQVSQALNRLRDARSDAVGRLLYRETSPIWRTVTDPARAQTLALSSPSPLLDQCRELASYVRGHPEAFLFHAVLSGLILAAIGWVRRRVNRLGAEANDYGWLIFGKPVTVSLLLSLLFCSWIYPEAPPLFWVIWGAATLIPATILLRQLLEPALFPVLNTLVAFYFWDQVRSILALMPLVGRWMFLAEMAVGALVCLWMLRAARFREPETIKRTPRRAARLALGLFIAAFAANAVGYGRLSLLVGEGTLRSAYLAVTLYGGLRVVDGLLLGLLSFGPLTRLRLVANHRALLWKRLRRWLHWATFLLWGLESLRGFALREPVLDALARLFRATLKIGALELSLANLVTFGLTVWASFLLSRLIRFVLEEDIYPRISLARGLPYAVSTMVHYCILLFGFFTATSVLGFDLTQFTILAGAFGVGLGFGLQNIFNNFVSGLILLFERPVKIGDVIFFDGVDGVVRQIGIRASVIETRVGSEMIVPNGRLIAERLTNWTYTNRRRGIEIPVSAPAGSDPEAVIALLKSVAQANSGVAASPAPEAMALKLHPGAEFELRVWTNHEEQWQRIRSDLIIAIAKALAGLPKPGEG